jgi:hypothetical protein
MVIATQRARRVTKEAALRTGPDDPGVDEDPGRDEAVPEPRGARVEQREAAPEPQAAADGPRAQAAPESPSEAEVLLEELLAVLLDAPSPFDDEGEDEGLWSVVADELPDELYARLDSWLEQRWG